MRHQPAFMGTAVLIGASLSALMFDGALAQISTMPKVLPPVVPFVQKAHQCHGYCDHGHKHGASPFCERITCVIGRSGTKKPKSKRAQPK